MWAAVDRKSKDLIDFEIGTKNTRYFENFSEKTSYVDLKKYATDRCASYNIIDPARRLIGKAHTTYTVERINLLLRNYLASLFFKKNFNASQKAMK